MAPNEFEEIKSSIKSCNEAIQRVQLTINKKLKKNNQSIVKAFFDGVVNLICVSSYPILLISWLFSFALPGVDWMKWFPFYAWYVVIKHFSILYGLI